MAGLSASAAMTRFPVALSGRGESGGIVVAYLSRLNADWTGRWTVADRIDRFGVGARLRF